MRFPQHWKLFELLWNATVIIMKFNFRIISLPINCHIFNFRIISLKSIQFQNHRNLLSNSISESSVSLFKFNFRIISLPMSIQFQNHRNLLSNSISESLASIKFQNHQSPYFQIGPESSSASLQCAGAFLLFASSVKFLGCLGLSSGSAMWCNAFPCWSVVHSKVCSKRVSNSGKLDMSQEVQIINDEHLDSIVGGRQWPRCLLFCLGWVWFFVMQSLCLHRCQWDQVINWKWMSDMGFIACRSWVLSLWAIKNPALASRCCLWDLAPGSFGGCWKPLWCQGLIDWDIFLNRFAQKT